ncbi:MAG TPA: metallophosphoesterase family protein [Gaiellaceae bacterium]
MRVAALYDVHGNLPALEAVLAEVEREGVDAIVLGGDIASGPPHPREVVELVRSLPDAHCIRGNADRVHDSEFADDEGHAWLLDRLGDEQADWLAGLPFSTVLDDTLYVHSNPQDDTTIVTELTTDEKLADLLRGVEQRRVVAGHTHMQLERLVGETLFVNAGSVGWPYEGTPGAYWAILGDGVELRRTDYDRERAAEQIRASGHPRAGEIAAENILVSATREEALAVFGG